MTVDEDRFNNLVENHAKLEQRVHDVKSQVGVLTEALRLNNERHVPLLFRMDETVHNLVDDTRACLQQIEEARRLREQERKEDAKALEAAARLIEERRRQDRKFFVTVLFSFASLVLAGIALLA